MFVLVVVTDEFAKNTILAPNVGTTTTNTATETVEYSGAKSIQKNLQNQLNILTKLKSQQNQQNQQKIHKTAGGSS